MSNRDTAGLFEILGKLGFTTEQIHEILKYIVK